MIPLFLLINPQHFALACLLDDLIGKPVGCRLVKL